MFDSIRLSLMVPCEEAAWTRILPLIEETEADGVEETITFAIPKALRPEEA